jgi:hypothetical protein
MYILCGMAETIEFTGRVLRVERDGFGIVEFDTPIGLVPNHLVANGVFSTTITSTLPYAVELRPGVRVSGTAEVDRRELAAVKTLRLNKK